MARWGAQMQGQLETSARRTYRLPTAPERPWASGLLVPVANPNTEDNLLQLAIILTKRVRARCSPCMCWPIAVAPSVPPCARSSDSCSILRRHCPCRQYPSGGPFGRIDDSIDWGVIAPARGARCRCADLRLEGVFQPIGKTFFGSVMIIFVRLATVPVLGNALPQPIENTRRVIFALLGRRGRANRKFRRLLS